MKDFWQKLPNKGQPPNSGHRLMYQLVLYSEVPLYSVLLTLWYCAMSPAASYVHSHHIISYLTGVRGEVSGVVTSPCTESDCKVSSILDHTPPGEVLVNYNNMTSS